MASPPAYPPPPRDGPLDRGATSQYATSAPDVVSAHDLLTRPLDLAMICGSVAFVLAGFIWPQAADSLLRLLLAVLGVGFIAARAYRSVHPVVSTENLYSPFVSGATARPPAVAPEGLLELEVELRSASAARSKQRQTIPASALQTISREAIRRLVDNHGLRLGEPAHVDRIRSLVSEPIWLLIASQGEPRPGDRATLRYPSIPLSQLGPVLDDLETL